YVNESNVQIEFTEEYKTVLGDYFNNTILSEWRSDNPTLSITLEEELNELQPEYLQSYFLISEPSNSTITILETYEKSRITGCVNGSLEGYYKGTIEGNLNGEISGYIDKRPMEIKSFFPPFLAPFLEWVYFATPDYFTLFPSAPDYRIDLGVGLGPNADFDWLKRPWYSKILEQEQEKVLKGGIPSEESYFSDLGIDYVHQNLFISLGQVVYNETGAYEGLFVLDFNLEYMMEVIELAITEDDFNLIVNKNGDILLSPEYLKNISRTPKEVFPTENIYDLNNTDLETAFSYSKQGNIGNATLTFENESYILIYQEIEQLDWYLLHFTPEDLLQEEFNPL
ncbi:MAG: cache domain-containing protein, partial [Candidatus Heimdallarchaeota archaeon]|nr:cache domain-containing protein [Candidatus Heimdallarchaeota archaeon]